MSDEQSKRKSASTFGTRLKAIMASRQLTHRAISEMAGCPISTVNEWVSGRTPRDLEKVAVLAQRLGISFEFLLLGRNGQPHVLAVTDLYDEVPAEELSGLFRIECKRLIPKGGKK